MLCSLYSTRVLDKYRKIASTFYALMLLTDEIFGCKLVFGRIEIVSSFLPSRTHRTKLTYPLHLLYFALPNSSIHSGLSPYGFLAGGPCKK